VRSPVDRPHDNAATSINLSANGSENAPNSVRESSHLVDATVESVGHRGRANVTRPRCLAGASSLYQKTGIKPIAATGSEVRQFSRFPYDALLRSSRGRMRTM